MKYFLKIFLIAVAVVTAIPSFAVTDKEMEQARALAAKHYLRYANNGSDYLDKLNPSSVSELSKSLKTKEVENLKSFNAVAVPKDYASWDKDKLVEYWSSTFFKSTGLKEDGKKCLGILAKNLKKINVSTPAPAPASETAPLPEETAKQDAAKAETNAPQASSQPEGQQESSSDTQSNTGPTTDEAVDNAMVQADADAGLADEQTPKPSNTGWYIGILVILIGVVIWLVMYASKSMKTSGAPLADNKEAEKEIRNVKRAAKEELNKMREQYASSLTSKNEEIKNLKARCEDLESQLESISKETESLKRALASANAAKESKTQQYQPQPQAAKEPNQQSKGAGLPPVVYLGHVNQKGLFTKASRSLNAEYSVYKMDIPDGHHGTFKVVNDPDALDRILENPGMWLDGGCEIENPEDADIAAEIVTLQEGEALFADNTCRVTKKARIKFI
ncbi:MAG: hypothetical protein K2G85_09335 [Muribaculaceae bacterium]|nr:hypothetical protein [Muribaculaceae bacterium]